MKKNIYNFPAIFYDDSDGISIEFPDLPGCLPCAKTMEEAFKNAREAMGLHLYGMEKDGDVIPAPTPVSALHPEEGGVVVMIEAYMPAVRAAQATRSVNRTVSLPAWLNAAAMQHHVNCSQLLQDALIAQLDLYRAHDGQ